jgi:MFS family permease
METSSSDGKAADPKQTARTLDWLNFFLADVRDGLGPYLAIYLLTVQKWDEASIGVVMTIGGIAAIVAQTPAGAWIDRTYAKRLLVIVAAILVTGASFLLPLFPDFAPVGALQILSGGAGSLFQPAIAAITLGIVGPKAFARRTGRNEAFNHAGNAMAAVIAGIAAYFFGPIVVCYLMAVTSVASVVATLAIPAAAIDHELARGFADDHDPSKHQPSGLAVLLACKPLMIFAACVTLFHFANAAMLPLVGQKLSLVNEELGTSLMSACIVAAQLVMVPVAMLVGAKADIWGRKPIFLAGFLILSIRGVLYTLLNNSFWLVGVQMLDGIDAGIFRALLSLVVADLTRGTGRFNVSQGAITTAPGIGVALSMTFAGFIVVSAGYSPAFLFLAAVAGVGLAVVWIAMPETLDSATRQGERALTMPAAAKA